MSGRDAGKDRSGGRDREGQGEIRAISYGEYIKKSQRDNERNIIASLA